MAHRPDYESADYKEGYEDGKREASKQWVVLSDEEMSEIFASIGWVEKDNNLKDLGFYDHARAIEAKLKDKNELFGNSR